MHPSWSKETVDLGSAGNSLTLDGFEPFVLVEIICHMASSSKRLIQDGSEVGVFNRHRGDSSGTRLTTRCPTCRPLEPRVLAVPLTRPPALSVMAHAAGLRESLPPVSVTACEQKSSRGPVGTSLFASQAVCTRVFLSAVKLPTPFVPRGLHALLPDRNGGP